MKRVLAIPLALLIVAGLPAAAAGAPPAAATGFVPGAEVTKNLHVQGFSENTDVINSDLAFWGNHAFQGHFSGFRIIDVSAPARPRVIVDYDQCVQDSAAGNQGDVIVWGNILVRSWNSPAPTGGAFCGNLFTPQGQEGIHIFDISDLRNPVGLAFVPIVQGSHTATAVPDLENNRLLVYNSASSTARQGIDIVEIPLDDPAAASHLRFVPAGRACHDTGVILGDAMLAACAGGNGFTMWTLDPAKGGSLDNPNFLYQRSVAGVTVGHTAAFSWDGETFIFGHEPGGGVLAMCQADTPDVNKTLFFFDTETGVEVGRWVLPRPQTATENCTIHNLNVIPTDQRNVLVAGNYQSGISVLDFTDPTNVIEVAYADPPPLDPEQLMLGGDWSSYWYNGRIYQSDISRGLFIWNLSDKVTAGAQKLTHLNPQTQEKTIPLKRPVDRNLTGNLEMVGHNPLFNRGMNAAMAIHGDYAYIGSRTDGTHPNTGVLILDISDPTDPEIVYEVGPPLEGNPRESSREMRVWSKQDILMILHTNCGGSTAHVCAQPSLNNWRFYDISGEFATNPRLIAELPASHNTHEFYLWEDPNNPDRALMYGGSAGSGTGAFRIWDLTPLLNEQPPVMIANLNAGFPSSSGRPTGSLHSLSVSNDGFYAYYALLSGGFAVVDISDWALGLASPTRRAITINAQRPTWPGPGAHSAVKFWNRDWVYVSDEVYGTATGSGHGCPWGWGRMIDISDPTVPVVRSEYRVPQNYTFLCSQFEPRPRTSFSAHNPTLTPNIVFTSWHSNGLQAISIENPLYPYKLADFYGPRLEQVNVEDPRLSSDPETGLGEKVVSWSYPIIKDGLIYVTDLRNGLFVLKYTGRFEAEVDEITFLEGNSNIGHALCYEPVGAAPDYCD